MMIQWQQTEENGEWDTGHHQHTLHPPANMLTTMYLLCFRIRRSVEDILFMFDVLDPVFIAYRLFEAGAGLIKILL